MKNSKIHLFCFLASSLLLFSCSKEKDNVIPLEDNSFAATIDGKRIEFDYRDAQYENEDGTGFATFGFIERNSADPNVILLYFENLKQTPDTYVTNGEIAGVGFMKLADYVDDIEAGWISVKGSAKVTKVKKPVLEGEVNATLVDFEDPSKSIQLTGGAFRVNR